MADFTIKQGDRLPILTATLLDQDDSVINLTGVTGVNFKFRLKGSTSVTTRPASITDAALGQVEYTWQTGDTDTPGLIFAEWQIDYGSGQFMTVPNTAPAMTTFHQLSNFSPSNRASATNRATTLHPQRRRARLTSVRPRPSSAPPHGRRAPRCARLRRGYPRGRPPG